jgi:DNA-directed RNA polymerase specialized sigma24 family protein
MAGRVGEALGALDPRDREVLLLAEWEGLAAAEIAKVMQCPAVTARGRLHRARRRFRASGGLDGGAGCMDQGSGVGEVSLGYGTGPA